MTRSERYQRVAEEARRGTLGRGYRTKEGHIEAIDDDPPQGTMYV